MKHAKKNTKKSKPEEWTETEEQLQTMLQGVESSLESLQGKLDKALEDKNAAGKVYKALKRTPYDLILRAKYKKAKVANREAITAHSDLKLQAKDLRAAKYVLERQIDLKRAKENQKEETLRKEEKVELDRTVPTKKQMGCEDKASMIDLKPLLKDSG